MDNAPQWSKAERSPGMITPLSWKNGHNLAHTNPPPHPQVEWLNLVGYKAGVYSYDTHKKFWKILSFTGDIASIKFSQIMFFHICKLTGTFCKKLTARCKTGHVTNTALPEVPACTLKRHKWAGKPVLRKHKHKHLCLHDKKKLFYMTMIMLVGSCKKSVQSLVKSWPSCSAHF